MADSCYTVFKLKLWLYHLQFMSDKGPFKIITGSVPYICKLIAGHKQCILSSLAIYLSMRRIAILLFRGGKEKTASWPSGSMYKTGK